MSLCIPKNLLLNFLLVVWKKFQKNSEKIVKDEKIGQGGHSFCYTLYSALQWCAIEMQH